MTPKAKAKELVEKMQNIPSEETEIGKIHFLVIKQTAIRQALIAVDEILNNVMQWWELPSEDKYFITQRTYWKEVKIELNKL